MSELVRAITECSGNAPFRHFVIVLEYSNGVVYENNFYEKGVSKPSVKEIINRIQEHIDRLNKMTKEQKQWYLDEIDVVKDLLTKPE